MDITRLKPISYNSTYLKKELSEPNIKQQISDSKDYNNTNIKLDKTEKIIDVVGKSNKKLQVFDRKLEISIHEKTREVMIKVIDTNTDEVIREIPQEKVLDNIANIKEMLGLLLDKRV